MNYAVRRQQEWAPFFLRCLKRKMLNRENLLSNMQIIILSILTNYLIICNEKFQFIELKNRKLY